MTGTGPTIALIVAAGTGSRTGGAVPKQFRTVGDKTLLAHAVDAFAEHPAIDGIVIVIGPEQERDVEAALAERPCPPLVQGGATRKASVRAGLDYLASLNAAPASVLIHDAARPFIPASVIDALVAALDTHDGAIPALPVADTIVRHQDGASTPVSREHLFRVQTPQAFRFDVVLDAHRQWSDALDATDDAQMVRESGHDVTIVAGSMMLDKITHAEDFERAEALVRPQLLISRTGLGFDVHRLEAGAELWLCGVKVPHSHGLAGHSDADVALHALVDAILGAIAEGDIGSHFPPSDPQWRGASSDRFLEFAVARVVARGGIIDHVDVTLICEAPKIGPHRDAMRARISEITRLDVRSVSVKATTTERLGMTGRGEGIAAQAAVTLRIPSPN